MNRISKIALLSIVIIGAITISFIVNEALGEWGKQVASLYIFLGLYTWYVYVLRMIRKHVGMKIYLELFIKVMLLIPAVLFTLERFLDIPITPAVFASKVFYGLNLVGILLLLAAFVVFSHHFQRLLKKMSIRTELPFVFFQLLFFPIGIWTYHDKMREWDKNNPRTNVEIRVQEGI